MIKAEGQRQRAEVWGQEEDIALIKKPSIKLKEKSHGLTGENQG
jgi:hypothetical protein